MYDEKLKYLHIKFAFLHWEGGGRCFGNNFMIILHVYGQFFVFLLSFFGASIEAEKAAAVVQMFCRGHIIAPLVECHLFILSLRCDGL